jgi:pyruvate,water dikinase
MRLRIKRNIIEARVLEEASEDIQRAILSTAMPGDLEQEILEAQARLAKECGVEPESLRVALRSSALGEDSELSFAGQYLSVLNVQRPRLLTNYRYVLASLYTPRAISYRLLKGIVDEDIAMSVACLEMIDSVASGHVPPFPRPRRPHLINAARPAPMPWTGLDTCPLPART